MAKYLIKWDAGYGENYDVIEADNQSDADQQAYEAWRDDAETNADYCAKILTPEIAENYGFENQLDDPQ